MAKIRKGKLEEFKQDQRNYNQATANGTKVVADSIDEVGIVRGMVVAADGTIMAGNTVHRELMKREGITVKKVYTKGDEIIIGRRTDIEGPGSEKFKKAALLDNLASEQNLRWNPVTISEDFTPEEVQEVSGSLAERMRKLIPEEKFKSEGAEDNGEYDFPEHTEEADHVAMISLFLTTENIDRFNELTEELKEHFKTKNQSDTIQAAYNYLFRNEEKDN